MIGGWGRPTEHVLLQLFFPNDDRALSPESKRYKIYIRSAIYLLARVLGVGKVENRGCTATCTSRYSPEVDTCASFLTSCV